MAYSGVKAIASRGGTTCLVQHADFREQSCQRVPETKQSVRLSSSDFTGASQTAI